MPEGVQSCPGPLDLPPSPEEPVVAPSPTPCTTRWAFSFLVLGEIRAVISKSSL